jgi:hypothetical protein
MIASTAIGLSVAELELVLRQAEPAALLVPPRILRRVIKKDQNLGGLGLRVPHRKSYFLKRDALLQIANRFELGVAADRELPAEVLLFAQPDAARLAAQPREQTLLEYWRLLFHVHVHLALARRRADGKLHDDAVRDRVARIGETEFDEVRSVLRQDAFLLSPDDSAAVYEEFAAVYLELRFFARERRASYFPDLTDFKAVDGVIAEDVDADAIFAATRLLGAAKPVGDESMVETDADPERIEPATPMAAIGAEPVQALMEKADRAAGRGNAVGAAILRMRAAQGAAPGQRQASLDAAHGAIENLLSRLGQALQISAGELDAWRAALIALVGPASAGRWPIEARFLYDLQKVCIDREHDIYAVDLVEWIVSWGHRPIKRLLPNQPLILTVKHLHTALHRLTTVRIAEPLRLRLVRLMLAAVQRGEQQLRDRFRPVIQHALDRVGLKAENYAERVSRDKLIEELLDRIVERRFLGMGELRDAIARNQLKLPDLAGPREFFLGDKLICANRQFADDLDGVYRRGEIYLRWLQRLSSAAFGTSVGRFLTLFLVLPFGGSYLALEGLHHVVEIFQTHPAHQPSIARTVALLASPEQGPLLAVSALVAERRHSLHLVNAYSILGLGLFLFALIHSVWFRRRVVEALTVAWHAMRSVLYEWPTAFLRLPWVRRVLECRPYLLLYQFVLKPLPWAAGAALACHLLSLERDIALAVGAGVFLTASLFYNSRIGMIVEEVCTDGVVRSWEHLSRDVVPGLYRMVMFLFKRLLGDLERVLYAVDELLRFRTGDSRFSLLWKPALGLLWFFVTYFIRLFINLFVEPTFNPIKHFPVVTVTAKLIVPIIKPLTEAIVDLMEPLGIPAAFAYTVAGSAIFFLPGLAGFLVWELKENWRTYRSNRPLTLEPVVVGAHGETVVRLLRPGLHSGTVPKLYSRLRRASGPAAHKQHESLHHVEASLRHFVERDLLAVLAGSKRWGGLRLEADVHLGTNRICFELRCPALAGDSVCLDLEEHADRLLAGLTAGRCGTAMGWLPQLNLAQAAAFNDALAGFCKLAGAEAKPANDGNMAARTFVEAPVSWTAWVLTWERDQESDKRTRDESR